MTFCRGDGRCEICDPPMQNNPDETEPIPTRCDCRYHDDGTTTVCGVHQPTPLMYYEPEETL